MIAALFLAMLTAAAPQGVDNETSVRAFVFTATGASGEHTAEEQGRLDAVRDVREALGKKKGITLVNNRADANLLIEVLSREQREEPGGGLRRQEHHAHGRHDHPACASSPVSRSRS